mmetsp:Transcript_123004/g.244811  ORF Transcript_123004/g.244811 Transcript_123004/m.244811 type:complete len:240 (+) Transcript_123004:80-799(+)|eukprot:CAMPEP_0172716444 /NCGR_PEP_ID=MMETSP1074-20121228/68391_1 /TAXON_ID=2916 /ORGANISM="Ceratium fusus, Strain PA161109" /LENGTH=239 /DNA_ID=CAMNT_0013541137 /DNA_START=80 /DNA_END=799 /DNA_ORIENTATION=+
MQRTRHVWDHPLSREDTKSRIFNLAEREVMSLRNELAALRTRAKVDIQQGNSSVEEDTDTITVAAPSVPCTPREAARVPCTLREPGAAEVAPPSVPCTPRDPRAEEAVELPRMSTTSRVSGARKLRQNGVLAVPASRSDSALRVELREGSYAGSQGVVMWGSDVLGTVAVRLDCGVHLPFEKLSNLKLIKFPHGFLQVQQKAKKTEAAITNVFGWSSTVVEAAVFVMLFATLAMGIKFA